ncbi:hypothetical protein [Pseudomonas sp. CGJS7]|uniref:hypothetical protein n=1 Tax=Pseudomonas sp. CGJS7 TaxID=3109348 RepID=UPI00300B7487
MIFAPPDLESALRAAIGKMGSFFSVYLDDIELDPEFELDSEDDVVVTSTSKLTLGYPRTEIDVSLSVEEFIDLPIEVADPRTTFDGLTYHSRQRTVVRMSSRGIRSLAFCERMNDDESSNAKVIAEVAGHTASVSLRSVSPHFGALIVLKNFFFDKYNPPLTSDEVFVEVVHAQGATPEEANAVIQAYLFELQATLGLEFFEWPRPFDDDIEYPEDEDIGDLVERGRNLRPLLLGPGLAAVLSEFNSGHSDGNGEASLLAYVKCIEYVSATVVREKQYEDLRKRLLSRDALSPNAEFMDGLLMLFEENRSFTRDAEALRLSVERCCDPTPMASHAPQFLRNLRNIGPTSTSDQRKASMVELASALSASRNQMAHAKANYRPTGKECPPEQLAGLVACARIAAEQCIRWYASRSAELRRS